MTQFLKAELTDWMDGVAQSMTREQIVARQARCGLFVPAPEAPIYMWNGWRVHEDSVSGIIKGDHVLLMPPRVQVAA